MRRRHRRYRRGPEISRAAAWIKRRETPIRPADDARQRGESGATPDRLVPGLPTPSGAGPGTTRRALRRGGERSGLAPAAGVLKVRWSRGRYGGERGEAALKPGGNAGMTAPGARGVRHHRNHERYFSFPTKYPKRKPRKKAASVHTTHNSDISQRGLSIAPGPLITLGQRLSSQGSG